MRVLFLCGVFAKENEAFHINRRPRKSALYGAF